MSAKPPVRLQSQVEPATTGAPPARGRFAGLRFSPAAGVIGSMAADAQRSRLPQMAAALAYRTIFGLIPVMVVALVGLKFFTSEADIERTLSQALAYAGLSEIVVDSADVSVPPEAFEHTWLVPIGTSVVPTILVPTGPGPAVRAEGEAGEAGPGTMAVESTGSARLDQWITQLVGRVSAIPFRTIGVIGLIALLYAAISMLVEIERAFNQIYRAPVGRSWARRITNYWSLLTLGVLMLFATFYVGEQFKNWASSLAQSSGLVGGNDSASVRTMGFATTVLISTTFLLLAYTSVPNTRVRLRPALAGAFLAAVLWELGKLGFTEYVSRSAGYARMYGAIAILPLFLLWVYVTWVIVLLGLQISYYLQFEQYRRPALATAPALPKLPPVVDPAASIAVVAAVARAFEDGRAVTAAALAATIRTGEDVVGAILDRLSAHNIVHAVEKDPARPDAPEGFTLSRPAGAISMAEVLETGYELVTPSQGVEPGEGQGIGAPAMDPIIERLRRAQVAEVRGMTVGELVGHPPGLASPLGVAPKGSAQANGSPPPGQNGSRTDGATVGSVGFSKPVAPATLPPAG